MNLTQWICEHTDSHAIQDSTKLKAKFAEDQIEAPGLVEKFPNGPQWPEHSTQETARNIEARGKGGHVKQDDKVMACYGFEVAEYFAYELAGWEPWQRGLGFRFNSAIQALKAKGY